VKPFDNTLPTRHLSWASSKLTPEMRQARNGHRGLVVWFTGLSGSGKSTVANAVEEQLFAAGRQVVVLDGDKLRSGLCADLGFSPEARAENIRRAGEVSRMYADAGLIVLAALISPSEEDRHKVRERVGADRFVEVFCDCPLDQCEARDPKGLYRKARAGVIPEFTGVSSPYERPSAPDLLLQTGALAIDECVASVLSLLAAKVSLS
jgi:adenylyl-sulfate kinase